MIVKAKKQNYFKKWFLFFTGKELEGANTFKKIKKLRRFKWLIMKN
jgi:hypothetical protein